MTTNLLEKQIEKCFKDLELEIEKILKSKSTDETDKDDIEMKLNHYITKSELSCSKDKYREYKYKFFRLQLSYLRATNQTQQADLIEEKMKDYEPATEDIIEDFIMPDLEEDIALNQSNKTIKKDEDMFPEAVTLLFKKEVINNELKQKLFEFDRKRSRILGTLDDFMYINRLYKQIDIELSNKLSMLDIDPNSDELSEIPTTISIIKAYIDNLRVYFTIGFMIYVENCTNPELNLFTNLQMYPDAIRKRFNELSMIFHPDKIKWLGGDNEEKARLFYMLIVDCKDRLIGKIGPELDIDSEKSIETLENRGHEFYKLALDYRKCYQKKWNEIKVLKQNEIPNLMPKEFQNLSTYFATLSFNEYKYACKIADKFLLLDKQLQLREHMALCLYLSDKLLEAQLVAISQVFLLKRSKGSTLAHKLQVRKLLEKLKCPGTEDKNVTKQNINLDNSIVLFEKEDEEFGEDDLHQIYRDLRKGLLVLANRENVRMDVPKSDLIKVKKSSSTNLMIKAATLGMGGVGISATVGMATFAFFGEASEIASMVTVGSLIGGPIVGVTLGIASSVITIITTGIGCISLIRKQKSLVDNKMKEIKCLENLNNILVEALKEHDQGNYMEFLHKLSKPYNLVEDENANTTNKKEKAKSILKIDEDLIDINAKEIIQTLLELNSAPDGIAYLLNLIANVLVSGHIKLKKDTFERLQAKACDILDQISSEELMKKAVELDKKVSMIRRIMSKETQKKILKKLESVKNFFQSLGILNWDSIMPSEHIEDANDKGSFVKRLCEIKLVAKINTAILSIVMSGTDGALAAETYMNEIKEFISESDGFFEDQTRLRLELLDFLFWIFTSKETNMSRSSNLRILSAEESSGQNLTSEENSFINFLDKQFQTAKKNEKISILKKKANFYFEKGEQSEKEERIECFCLFQRAYLSYKDAYKLNKEDTELIVKILKCLIKLKRFKEAYDLFCNSITISYDDSDALFNDSGFESNAEAWLYAAISCRYLDILQHAKSYILESLKKAPSKEALKEQKIIDNLIKEKKIIDSVEKRVEFYKSNKNRFESNLNTKSALNSVGTYKIISIDGGGVRGILPAMLLCEIERRANRPLVEMCNLIAGTSTGAIIAAGLSMSKTRGSLEPLLYSSDIFEMYVNKSQDIFESKFSHLFSNYKYPDENRYRVFQSILDKRFLDETLCDVVIPAVKNTNIIHTFSSYEAKLRPDKNNSILDVLMATSAAPTYFPSYFIEHLGNFYDGGVLVNNPARLAYEEVISNKLADPNNIFLLSLGTGNFVSDPFNMEKSRSMLYWAQNISDIMISGQEIDVDNSLKKMLNNRYKRWQVYLDSPIRLDDSQSVSKLIDLGKHFIEEQDDSINEIVKIFERGIN